MELGVWEVIRFIVLAPALDAVCRASDGLVLRPSHLQSLLLAVVTRGKAW